MACSHLFPIGTVLSLVVILPAPLDLRGQATKEGSPVSVILDVTNQHFTMARKIPSLYVRVFSDRTVQCHALAGSRGADPVKTKVLTEEEFKGVQMMVGRCKRLSANQTYPLRHMVFDSWMEWDIKVPRKNDELEISIADFGSTGVGIYPPEIGKLGCLISRLRDEVYGDERQHRLDNCKDVSEAK